MVKVRPRNTDYTSSSSSSSTRKACDGHTASLLDDRDLRGTKSASISIHPHRFHFHHRPSPPTLYSISTCSRKNQFHSRPSPQLRDSRDICFHPRERFPSRGPDIPIPRAGLYRITAEIYMFNTHFTHLLFFNKLVTIMITPCLSRLDRAVV